MRLLLVIDSLDIGGAERHVVDLAVTLQAKGHAVTVACSASGPLAGELWAARVPVQVLMRRRVKRRFNLAYAWKLRRLVRVTSFDLVHAHLHASATAAALALHGDAVPLLLSAHSEATWQRPWDRWIGRQAYRRSRHIIAVSESIRRHLIDFDGLSPERISVIPHAVSRAPESNEFLRLPVGWEHRPLVGVVARLQAEKGLDVFLDAVARVIQLCPEARYLVVGDGPLRGVLAAQVRRLALQQHVHFLGIHRQATAVMPALDLLVVPSLTEGSPLVVLEAMAAGVPIVATGVGGIPQQIRHRREGLLTQAGDARALAGAMVEMLHDREAAQRLGRAGQERLLTAFSYDAMLREIAGCYEDALRGVPSLAGGVLDTLV